ncbi:hypothetical protein LCGC14_0302750 [marine sediment metagenome]|uniref:Uncharacterized protein n=1 Tax=marine sediment metagenome TaxID=412755 RepID=A0A0F9WVQ3_9ZZZZ
MNICNETLKSKPIHYKFTIVDYIIGLFFTFFYSCLFVAYHILLFTLIVNDGFETIFHYWKVVLVLIIGGLLVYHSLYFFVYLFIINFVRHMKKQPIPVHELDGKGKFQLGWPDEAKAMFNKQKIG